MKVSPRTESNSAGFGVNETRRIPLCAAPASSIPAFNPFRGSLPVGYVCATSAGATASETVKAVLYILRAFPIGR
jgi:hypothetical protein